MLEGETFYKDVAGEGVGRLDLIVRGRMSVIEPALYLEPAVSAMVQEMY